MFPVNYWDDLTGTASHFHYSHMQLHSGTFFSCAISHMQWQCRNKWGKGRQADGSKATFLDIALRETYQRKKMGQILTQWIITGKECFFFFFVLFTKVVRVTDHVWYCVCVASLDTSCTYNRVCSHQNRYFKPTHKVFLILTNIKRIFLCLKLTRVLHSLVTKEK